MASSPRMTPAVPWRPPGWPGSGGPMGCIRALGPGPGGEAVWGVADQARASEPRLGAWVAHRPEAYGGFCWGWPFFLPGRGRWGFSFCLGSFPSSGRFWRWPSSTGRCRRGWWGGGWGCGLCLGALGALGPFGGRVAGGGEPGPALWARGGLPLPPPPLGGEGVERLLGSPHVSRRSGQIHLLSEWATFAL